MGKIKSIIHSTGAYVKILSMDYSTILILIWAVKLLSMEKVISISFDITLAELFALLKDTINRPILCIKNR